MKEVEFLSIPILCKASRYRNRRSVQFLASSATSLDNTMAKDDETSSLIRTSYFLLFSDNDVVDDDASPLSYKNF